jgi:hypothetical protein
MDEDGALNAQSHVIETLLHDTPLHLTAASGARR